MAWTEAQIINRISTALNDSATAIWGTATVAAQMELDIRLLSDYQPQLAQATVSFAGTARELSLASIADLLDVDEVEFPIDKHPKRYVTASRRGGSVILDTYLPSVSSSDTAYIWYSAPHTVSGSTNTLDRTQEGILVELVASHLLQNISLDRIESINIGGADTWRSYITAGERREQKVMSRLIGGITSKFGVRYPDVK